MFLKYDQILVPKLYASHIYGQNATLTNHKLKQFIFIARCATEKSLVKIHQSATQTLLMHEHTYTVSGEKWTP